MNDTIKTNCAHCAHKHLTAAYALLTSNTEGSGYVHATLERVLLARATITVEESLGDYAGNANLAMGCLAAAEGITKNRENARRYRQMRLSLAAPCRSRQQALELFGDPVDVVAHALAHLAEAKRELPDLALAAMLLTRDSNGTLSVQIPCPSKEFCETLVTLIHDVAELYELHHEKEAKS